MKPAKLSALIDALESESEENLTYVDLEKGAVVFVDAALLRALEEGDEGSLVEVPAWQKSEIKIARAILGDSGERFISTPDKFDFHEYRHMERFVGSVQNPVAAEQLWRAIKGKGAFRLFKFTAHRLGLLEQWYAYRQQALREYIEDWAAAHQVPFVNDLNRTQSDTP
jgi:hypothetical protein